MLDEIRSRIEREIATLTEELNRDLPARIKIAMEHGDLRENAEFKAAKERQAFVEARLNHLTSRMTELSRIDVI
jgi:transcription elongation factor GreA